MICNFFLRSQSAFGGIDHLVDLFLHAGILLSIRGREDVWIFVLDGSVVKGAFGTYTRSFCNKGRGVRYVHISYNFGLVLSLIL